ncbi:kinesin-domain-containing protein, partial [Lichtheimia hyalospora FSU 10163]
MAKESAAVQVALRIRPLTNRDRAQPRFANLSNDDVLKLHEKTVHVVPHNKLFTFDHVFGTNSQQSQVFETLGSKLIHKFIDGYNVTILAYGQTSSGKTYTMGTAQHQSGRYNLEEEGIVPRAMALLFDTLTGNNNTPLPSSPSSPLGGGERPITPAPSVSSSTDNTTGTRLRPPSRISMHHHPPPPPSSSNNNNTRKFSVKVSFIEIYNEELNDLLNGTPVSERPPITIREDAKGHIYWTGVKEVPVHSMEDVLFYLEQGTRNRATGATDMNEKSSRSHAIFSVSLKHEKWVSRSNQGDKRATRDGEWMVSSSKFHFVDLAGSERLKRTAAEGDRRKEGININAGLLALGNVISALGDPSKRGTHVPYRDSKLTRLLQDSLGGSATTLMIACVSPAEYNLSETLNTLQYANRARNIKNRVEKNEVEEWMTTENIELLRSMIGKLKHEVRNLKSGSVSSSVSSTIVGSDHGGAAAATTTNTDVDQLFQEQRLVIADLQRQVEELDGEASVTRERNRVVEAELKRLRTIRKREEEISKTNNDFQHLVEPVIEEYEKSITALESQLAMARAALNHSDIGFEEQRAKLEQCELMLETQDQTVLDLRTRITKLQEREQSNETYIDELEGKLMQSAKDARRDQELLNELKSRIMRFKETDENTEQYIFDLEQRLATSEADKASLEKNVEDLENRISERDDTIVKLREQLAKAEDTDTQKLMLNELDELTAKYNQLEKERDQLKAETSDSVAAMAAKKAEERAEHEAARALQLERDLRELREDHHETAKELDEVLLRYQEALEQVEMLQ